VKHPKLGPLLGGVAARLAGVPSEFMYDLYTDSEYQRASRMTYDELADEALAAKISMPPARGRDTPN
jgi:hypothetical protein